MADQTGSATPPVASSATGSTSTAESRRALPIHILDLGRARSGDVKDLKKGRGKLLDEITDALVDVQATVDDASGREEIVPVVLIVERKRKRKRAS